MICNQHQQLLCISALGTINDLGESAESSDRASQPFFASLRSVIDGITYVYAKCLRVAHNSPVVTLVPHP